MEILTPTLVKAIGTALAILLAAIFAGFVLILKEIRTILNGKAEKREIRAESRHGEELVELKTMSRNLKELSTAVINHNSTERKTQTELLKEISASLKEKKGQEK